MNKLRRFRLLGFLLCVSCLLAPRAGRGGVFLIGIDGADRDLVAALTKAGRMPNLAALIKDGVQGELDTFPPLPLSSPVIWTSMATGKSCKKHGIEDFMRQGSRTRYSSRDRREAALWNMVSSQKKTVAVVGFLVTYPAEPVNGIMITNNYFTPAGTQAVVYPGGLKLETTPDYIFKDGGMLEETARIAGYAPAGLAYLAPSLKDYGSEDFQKNYIFGKLNNFIQKDTAMSRLEQELLGKNKFDLFITYHPEVDHISHLAWGRYAAAKAGAKTAFGDLVPSYYAYTDELIGAILAKAGKDDTVIVVSDHGFMLSAGAGPLTVVSGDHRPGGLFAARGPGIKSGARLAKPLIDWDIAPTVLYLMGLPAARDMDGRIAEEILKDGYLAAHPAAYVDSYPQPAAGGAPQDLPFTLQELERLRLSGYLQ